MTEGREDSMWQSQVDSTIDTKPNIYGSTHQINSYSKPHDNQRHDTLTQSYAILPSEVRGGVGVVFLSTSGALRMRKNIAAQKHCKQYTRFSGS